MQRLYCTSVSDNYIEDFGSGATPGTWYGIYASLQGGVGSVIDNNRINGASKEPRSASKYVYLGITGNYGVGSVGVAGNQIFGAGTTRGVGFQYALGKSTNIIVTSEGNSEMNVHTQRIVGPGVTVTSGD
jgi:hypothetical protein